jgi:hypothetical protein
MTDASNQDIYSIEKLMHETRQLAAKYRKTTGTALPVTTEIARFDAAKALNLILNEDNNNDFDAVGLSGARATKRFLIKGRVLFETSKSSPRIGQLNVEKSWDRIVLVIFDEEYQAEEMYEATRDDIADAMYHDSNRKKRGAMSVAQFKIISELVWTSQDGLIDKVWDNQNHS